MLDLVGCFVADVQRQARPHQLKDSISEVAHGNLDLVREVERLSAYFGTLGERLSKRNICRGPIFDVEVIADKTAVGSNYRALIAQDRANGARNDAIPVQVASAVKIA